MGVFEKNRKLQRNKGNDCDERVNYIGNIGCYREKKNEYGHGGAAATYWNIDRKDETVAVWFTQNLDLPDMIENGDLWKVLHGAIKKPVANKARGKRRLQSTSSGQSKKARRH